MLLNFQCRWFLYPSTRINTRGKLFLLMIPTRVRPPVIIAAAVQTFHIKNISVLFVECVCGIIKYKVWCISLSLSVTRAV
jgi:hypothetical protein